jgi:uncharacterized SAM-dependent methyltransferase
LHELSSTVQEIQLEGLCGSYHDAVNYLDHENFNTLKNNTPRRPLVILWLGSSIGNMKREEAAGFINFFRRSVFMHGDLWITGIDGRHWSAERAWKDNLTCVQNIFNSAKLSITGDTKVSLDVVVNAEKGIGCFSVLHLTQYLLHFI